MYIDSHNEMKVVNKGVMRERSRAWAKVTGTKVSGYYWTNHLDISDWEQIGMEIGSKLECCQANHEREWSVPRGESREENWQHPSLARVEEEEREGEEGREGEKEGERGDRIEWLQTMSEEREREG